MPSQGPNLPGSASQTNVGQSARLAWDNPGAVQTADSIVATCSISPATYRLTNKLVCTNFGFTIPEGYGIVGVALTFNCRSQIGTSVFCRNGVAELVHNGLVVGQIASDGGNWNTSFVTRTIGGSTNLWGWTSATRAKVNDSSFGIRLEAQVPEDIAAEIDWIKVEVYYTEQNFAGNQGSGGVGVGGYPAVKVKPTVRGGVGVGRTNGWKYKPGTSGGVGVNGTSTFRRKRMETGSGGLGVGHAVAGQKVFINARGGPGIGAESNFHYEVHKHGSGGLGVGGQESLLKNGFIATGGAGVGGAADFYRRRPVEGSGGLAVGYTDGELSRRAARVAEGGVGVGSDLNPFEQLAKIIATGGVGVGGAAGLRRSTSTGTDVEDEIERSHRGPVTRRMVYEAIRRALVDGPLNRYRVHLADDEPDMTGVPAGNSFAVILPRSATNDQGDLAGGGAHGTMRTDMAEVRVYSSSNIDQSHKSTAWNLKIDTGAMERARKVRRTLNMLDLMDDAGWILLSQPMRATTTGDPRQRRSNPQWGYYAETFETVYKEYLG